MCIRDRSRVVSGKYDVFLASDDFIDVTTLTQMDYMICLLYTSILAAYGKEIDQSVISDYKEISGYGISVMAGEKKVFAGNTKLMDTECIESVSYTHLGHGTNAVKIQNGQ